MLLAILFFSACNRRATPPTDPLFLCLFAPAPARPTPGQFIRSRSAKPAAPIQRFASLRGSLLSRSVLFFSARSRSSFSFAAFEPSSYARILKPFSFGAFPLVRAWLRLNRRVSSWQAGELKASSRKRCRLSSVTFCLFCPFRSTSISALRSAGPQSQAPALLASILRRSPFARSQFRYRFTLLNEVFVSINSRRLGYGLSESDSSCGRLPKACAFPVYTFG